jgi:hypothetical protein
MSHTDFAALIPFASHTLADEVQQTINARDLHANLEITKDYTSWVKAQIKRANLSKDLDYITFTQKGETATVGSTRRGHALTVSLAPAPAFLYTCAQRRSTFARIPDSGN